MDWIARSAGSSVVPRRTILWAGGRRNAIAASGVLATSGARRDATNGLIRGEDEQPAARRRMARFVATVVQAAAHTWPRAPGPRYTRCMSAHELVLGVVDDGCGLDSLAEGASPSLRDAGRASAMCGAAWNHRSTRTRAW